MRTLVRASLSALLFVTAAPSALAHDGEYFQFTLSGSQEVPPVATPASGAGCGVLDTHTNLFTYHYEFSGLSSAQTAAHIHGFAPAGSNAGILFDLGLGSPKSGSVTLSAAQAANFLADLAYINVHSTAFPGGEIRGQIARQPPLPLVNFCAGDGSGTACPCGNEVPAGVAAGCRHSAGAGAVLRGEGVPSVNCESFGLRAANLPGIGAVLFFQGTARVSGGAGAVFGDGLRCVDGVVVRLGTLIPSGGAAELDDPGQLGGATPGTTLYYQAWYRNTAPFCAPTGFNLTDALEVVWLQ